MSYFILNTILCIFIKHLMNIKHTAMQHYKTQQQETLGHQQTYYQMQEKCGTQSDIK